MFEFKDKVAFVTGGASGIGLAIGKALLNEGCNVVLADIDADALEVQKKDINSDKVMIYKLDVRSMEVWAAAKEATEAAFGPVSILCNVAGVMDLPGAPMAQRGLVDYDQKRWDRMINISLTGMAYGVMTFGPGIRDRRNGYILNTASTQGLIPTRGVAAYSASKFGVVAMTEALRDELTDDDVGVSVLIPGVISTNLAANEIKRVGIKLDKPLKMPGMDPELVGKMVINGIKNNLLYIITHGEYRKFCDDRFARITAAFTDVPVSKDYDPSKVLAGTREWARETAEKEAEAKKNQ